MCSLPGDAACTRKLHQHAAQPPAMPPRAQRSSRASVASSAASSPPAGNGSGSAGARHSPRGPNSKTKVGTPTKPSKSAPTSNASPKSPAASSRIASRTPSKKEQSSPIIYRDDDEDESDSEEDQVAADDSADDFQAEDDSNDDEHDDDDHDDLGGSDDDDDDEDAYTGKGKGKGKKKATPTKRKSTSQSSTPSKRARKSKPKDESEDEFDEDDFDDDDPKRVRRSLGLVPSGINAPTTGHVPPTQVSPHLFNLLRDLNDPEKNDRDWFKARDKLWRYCEKTWLSFVETLTEAIMEKGDDTIPFLPPKDISYRIYRDVRFSASKVPYKTEVQCTFSREGRKGRWAGYHLSVSPLGKSYVAAGKWHPDKEELGRIRQHILDETALGTELKQVINGKEFVKMFGAPVKSVSGIQAEQRTSLWGFSDQLKISPKIPGLDPDHKNMHWLRLKSFVAHYRFKDEEVLRPDFQDKICQVIAAMRPLTSVLNRMVFGEDVDGPVDGESGDDGGGEDGGEGKEEELEEDDGEEDDDPKKEEDDDDDDEK
ncbi:hypothetical protein V8E36_004880 [Tilletia maclaganii]